MVIIVIPAYVLALSSSIQPIEIEWNFRNYAIKPISICKKKNIQGEKPKTAPQSQNMGDLRAKTVNRC